MTGIHKRYGLKGLLLIPVFLIPGLLFSQQILDNRYLQQMKQDIKILASDSLEGREAGTMGELLAALYIADRFEEMGLKTWFNGCWYQDFDFPDGYEFTAENNRFSNSFYAKESGVMHSVAFTIADFTPLPWGADGIVSGEVTDAGWCMEEYPFVMKEQSKGKKHKRDKEGDTSSPGDLLKGKVFLVRYDTPPDFEKGGLLSDIMLSKARYAEKSGAAAVIFYDPHGMLAKVPANYFKFEEVFIPVIFMHDHKTALALTGTRVDMQIKNTKRRSPGKNVAAWIDNGAEQTVVIGAHYDHLGWGSYNTRHDGIPEIHYGADDNASGVAGVLALAAWLRQSDLTNKNYLFAAFSAEEKGLYGSRVFVEDASITSDNIFAMLNFDMIGRVDSLNPKISLLAAGSSPLWPEIIEKVTEDVEALPVKGSVSGSDHHHFYYNDIPVLFLFSGLHDDYHKPTDVIEKINFKGLRDVVEYTINMLHILDTLQQLPFQEVEEESQMSRRNLKFSLGIVPDHGVEVEGVRVQEVLRERPAEIAGVIRGDVITGLAGLKITNMHEYMRALNQIEPGQMVEITVLRNDQQINLSFQF